MSTHPSMPSIVTGVIQMVRIVRGSTRLFTTTGLFFCFVVLAALGMGAAPAEALPSYAQQTGVGCTQCHTIGFGPALTEYGRQFKLNGYSWGGNSSVPLAAMVVGSLYYTSSDQADPPAPHFSRNDNVTLDEASLFLA